MLRHMCVCMNWSRKLGYAFAAAGGYGERRHMAADYDMF